MDDVVNHVCPAGGTLGAGAGPGQRRFRDLASPSELACELEKLTPELPVLLTTGYSGNVKVELGRPVLRKPYQIQDLQLALPALTQHRLSA